MAGEKGKLKKESGGAMYALAAIVVIAAAAAVGYYGGFFAQPAQPAKNASAVLPLATPEARLLLAAFDKGASLGDYSMNYTANDNGARSSYALVKSGSESWVGVRGVFGRMEGFFGADNASDAVCLEYEGVLKCAIVGNDTDMADIAASLKILRPNRQAYLDQKDDTRKLISVGAIVLASGMENESVGGFGAQKITYTLDYSNLTVQQMVSLGISPSDEALLSVTDQVVAFWIDKESGMLVKSHAAYKKMGVPGFYDTEYTELNLTGGHLPKKPAAVVPAEAFADFYAKSTKDYAARAACNSKAGKEKGLCFRNIAVEKGSWETCQLIDDKQLYESCTLIVAQQTHNKVLCEKLEMLADECYVAVAGETGNFELCQRIKNQSLLASCSQAAAAGQKKAEAEEAALARVYAARNCAADSDCKAFGNAGQYCEPKNVSGAFANETSPLFACLTGVPCGCQQGFCSFAKNETYYKCLSDMEEALIEEYIRSLIPPDNSTAQNGTAG